MTQCPRCCGGDAGSRLAACPRCLAEAQLPVHRLGESLEIGEVIGEGGMGTVFAGRDLRLGREVAVKVLSAEVASRDESRARFRREAQALARLSHPGIVALFDFGEADGECYLVMERVHGAPLSRHLPLPYPKACELAVQICDAVGYAHGRGVVHRDLKPENVLIDGDGRAKVADFGIARLVNQEGWTLTRPDRVVGTPHYLAPEALKGAAPDPRSDVYSLGVLVHQMFSGRLPVGSVAPLSESIARVIRRALAEDPSERFADAGEMAEELRRVEPNEGDPLPADERTWRGATALVLTVASAIFAWALLSSLTPKVMAAGDIQPLTMLVTTALDDGRVVSRVRFEPWPTLLSALAAAGAMLSYGLLRRHWRTHRLESHDQSTRAVPTTAVFCAGAAQALTYAVHRLVFPGDHVVLSVMPVLGGLAGLGTLWLSWLAVLELLRRHASVLTQARLWLGLAMAALPSCAEFLNYLRHWRP